MKFSIIIPLEFHRGQSERCVRAWCQQRQFASCDYEVICVVPQNYPVRERKALLGTLRDHDRLIESQAAHDMAHCVEGAAAAKGENFFFTESHVWPEPTVLIESIAVLHQQPSWAGFSCKTERITTNLLSEVEADMYESEIQFGMNVHPWRKILDQCFVTRREPYFAAGGFDAKLGHFAEWVLAHSYFERGFKIGYAPSIRLHHYYIGKISELTTFTSDFVDGEMRYFLERDLSETLLVPPSEWGNLDRQRSRYLVETLWRYVVCAVRIPTGSGIYPALQQLARIYRHCNESHRQPLFFRCDQNTLVPHWSCICSNSQIKGIAGLLVQCISKSSHSRAENSNPHILAR
jgi:hypothetical protein